MEITEIYNLFLHDVAIILKLVSERRGLAVFDTCWFIDLNVNVAYFAPVNSIEYYFISPPRWEPH